MELVTVIVPVYNVKKYLVRCVESITNQSYENLEIILVDDGSNDGSLAVCKELAKKDNRINVYHTENSGLSHARNIGLDHASGDYIVFVDSDDYIHKDMISTMICKSNGADLVICNYERVANNSKEIIQDKKCLKDEFWDFKQFWQQYYWNNLRVFCCVAWNKLYRKKLFDNLRYPLNKIHEDEYIINDIVSQCQKITVITDSLYYYVQRANSIMHKHYQGNFENAEALLRRCADFQSHNLQDILRENLNEIPLLLVMGLDETRNQEASKKRYRYLRRKYNFFLRENFNKRHCTKLYLKSWLLAVPNLYILYIKTKKYLIF